MISEATAASVRKMLEGVLGPGGTASGAAIKGYNLAGKTGTAEKAINGGYSKDKYVASFVGFAPAEHAEAAGRRHRRRAQRRDLRRPGRRAGVARDRQLRARLPEDRSQLGFTHGRRDARPGRQPVRPVRGRRPARGRRRRCARRWSARAAAGRSSASREAGARGRVGRGAGARPPRGAQRAAPDHPRPLRPPRRRRSSSIRAGTGCSTARVEREIHALPWADPRAGRARRPRRARVRSGRTPTPA